MGLQVPIDFTLPGLKEKRKIGLGLAGDVSKYLKHKTKNFLNEQVHDLAQEIVEKKITLPEALRNKVARFKNKIKKVGAGRRGPKRRKPTKKKRGRRKTVKRRQKINKRKKTCNTKGTIFAK